ncbi:MAG: hypothetical protein ACAI44_29710 [Candidatus Sericytochromatia bacterium]
MNPILQKIWACTASAWLEEKLLPLALVAAGLSPETSLEELSALNLPVINPDAFASYAETEASIICAECALFGAVMLARELVDSEKARKIADCIHGLMWRDAIEYSNATELECALEQGLQRAGDAEDQWDRWMKTGQAVLASNAAFYYDFVTDYL